MAIELANQKHDTGDGLPDLAEQYAEMPVLRSLLQLLPGGIGGAADVWIVARAEKVRRRRARVFFDELATGEIKLTAELIDNDDFLHAFHATSCAALNARHEAKIRMFARLLLRGAVSAEADSLDDYEELVGILDELSYREWRALLLFADRFARASQDSDMGKVNGFWSDFERDLEEQLQVPRAEVSSFMIRIGRTGLFHEITGAYFDYAGGLGVTSPKFERFRRLIEEAPQT